MNPGATAAAGASPATAGLRIDATRLMARLDALEATGAIDAGVVRRVESVARRLGFSQRRMTSGAGHDDQMLARICPSAMIFAPSVRGISHNPAEHTEPADLAAGAGVLLHTLLGLVNDGEAN